MFYDTNCCVVSYCPPSLFHIAHCSSPRLLQKAACPCEELSRRCDLSRALGSSANIVGKKTQASRSVTSWRSVSPATRWTQVLLQLQFTHRVLVFWYDNVCYFPHCPYFQNAGESHQPQRCTRVSAGHRRRGCDIWKGGGSCVCGGLQYVSSFAAHQQLWFGFNTSVVL